MASKAEADSRCDFRRGRRAERHWRVALGNGRSVCVDERHVRPMDSGSYDGMTESQRHKVQHAIRMKAHAFVYAPIALLVLFIAVTSYHEYINARNDWKRTAPVIINVTGEILGVGKNYIDAVIFGEKDRSCSPIISAGNIGVDSTLRGYVKLENGVWKSVDIMSLRAMERGGEIEPINLPSNVGVISIGRWRWRDQSMDASKVSAVMLTLYHQCDEYIVQTMLGPIEMAPLE